RARSHTARGSPGTGSTRTCRPERSCCGVFSRRGPFTAPGGVVCLWLGSAERPEPLVRAAAHQRLETETDRLGVCRCARSGPGIAQEPLVDVQSLLHTANYAIQVWLKASRRSACKERPTAAKPYSISRSADARCRTLGEVRCNRTTTGLGRRPCICVKTANESQGPQVFSPSKRCRSHDVRRHTTKAIRSSRRRPCA